MPSTTLTALIARAKAASDMRDNFVTPAQWEYWATQERYGLDLYLARCGWPLPLATFDITVAGTENGVYTVNPTTGVMAVVCVHQVKGDSYRLLRHTNAVDFIKSTGRTGDSIEYRVTWSGDNLALGLWPTPNNADVYRVTYLAHPLKLRLVPSGVGADNETGSVAYPMGWEERIVLGMARRALIKEESDTKAIDSEIMVWESRIEEAAWSRVLSDVPSVRNSDYLIYGWTDRYSIPPYTQWAWV